jgi:Spy/CpxP family protein refolding chaperone
MARHLFIPYQTKQKNAMKKLIVLSIAMMMSFISFSQEQKGRQGYSPEHRAQKVAAELELSEEQTQQLAELFQQRQAKMKALREEEISNRKALYEDYSQQMSSILGEDKFQAYQEAKKEQMKQHKNQRAAYKNAQFEKGRKEVHRKGHKKSHHHRNDKSKTEDN